MDAEVDLLDEHLATLMNRVAPDLTALRGVGTEVAGALLVAAGDNPERLTARRPSQRYAEYRRSMRPPDASTVIG